MDRLEIVAFYVGFGFPEFRKAAEYFVESARDVYPDCVLTHLTDQYTPPLAGFDIIARVDKDVGWDEVIASKGESIAIHARDTIYDRSMFCDLDIIHNKPFEFGEWDVAFLHRIGRPHKAFNGGIQYSQKSPGSRAFWVTYENNIKSLCKPALAWWAEQLVMGCMFGIYHDPGVIDLVGTRVGILDMNVTCPKVREVPKQRHDTPAVHFAGLGRKDLMRGYNDLERISGPESSVT